MTANARISYLWRGTDLNDATNYLVPLADTAFDDRNSADTGYAYRKGDVPVATSLTIKEGSFVLPINIVATTDANFRTKLATLKALFNPADAAFYSFGRRLRTESVYSTIQARPTAFAVDIIQRRLIVTMTTPDRAWLFPTVRTATGDFFVSGGGTATLSVTYAGLTPVEPTITITALVAGSDGPRPLFYRDVVVYTQGAHHIVHDPLLLVTGWSTTALVAATKMRSDGLDITVEHLDGTPIPRYIGGTAASRKVWIKPDSWPQRFDVVLVAPPTWDPMAFPEDPMLTSGATKMYVSVTPPGVDALAATADFPSSGTVYVDNEAITYSGVKWLNSNLSHYTEAELTITARGALGTTAAAHYSYVRVRMPTTVRVRYGYATGYLAFFHNNLINWPLLDYENSDNTQWTQVQTWSPILNHTQWAHTRNWVGESKIQTATNRPYTGESLTAGYNGSNSAVVDKSKIVGGITGNPNATLSNGWQRLLLRLPSVGRKISTMKLTMTLKGGASGATGRVKALFNVVRANIGNPTAQNTEIVETLWTATQLTSTPTSVNTGFVSLNSFSQPVQGVALDLFHAAPGNVLVTHLILDKVEMTLDTEYAGYPVAGALGSEGGGFSVHLSALYNATDTQTSLRFNLATLMAVNDVATIDCLNRTVVGALVKEVAYQNPTWLRLLPGANTITIVAPASSGKIRVALSWYDKN